jgi:gamma-glutamylcyclotransferase (GGCT)/AIG2-like uncharacterized protein YtfP
MPENREEAFSESVNVFTYGSLMYAPVWSQIVSGSYESVEGTVRGYQRFAVLDEDYPAVVEAAADATVSGRVYLNVNAADLQRLDEFEGEYYFRDRSVMTSPQGDFEVQLYVIKPEYSGLLSTENWSPKEFEQAGLQRFLARYGGFQRI